MLSKPGNISWNQRTKSHIFQVRSNITENIDNLNEIEIDDDDSEIDFRQNWG